MLLMRCILSSSTKCILYFIIERPVFPIYVIKYRPLLKVMTEKCPVRTLNVRPKTFIKMS
jgi:hypothetical protein